MRSIRDLVESMLNMYSQIGYVVVVVVCDCTLHSYIQNIQKFRVM